MRKKILFLLSFIFAVTSYAQNGWSVLATNTTLDLLRVQAYSGDTVFAAGDNGILLKSFNGGSSFNTYTGVNQSLYTALYFRTADTGFVANGSGNVRRTTDGGQSFSTVGSCTCFIKDIAFSSPQAGLYSGVNGVYRSSNGGASFAGTPLSILPQEKITSPADSVFFTYRGGVINKSVDYGQTFAGDTVHSATNYGIVGISFYNATQGYALSDDGYLYQTNDQGNSWNLIYNTGFGLSYFVFLDSLNGYLVAGSPNTAIYKTSNGGQNWIVDYVAAQPLNDLSTKQHVIYASGNAGLLFRKDANTAVSEEQAADEVQLFPNPSAGETNLYVPSAYIGEQFRICDMSGRIVLQGKITGMQNTISISELASGIYLLRIGKHGGRELKLVRQ